MTVDLEVHINSEVHLVPWQSLLLGHKSSHPSPELPVSPLALILHEPQVLHTYRPTYLPTDSPEMSRTAPEVTLPDLLYTYYTTNDGFKTENTTQSTRTAKNQPEETSYTNQRSLSKP